MKISLIVAMDEDGYIGIKGSLPWSLKSDMARFKHLTIGDGFNSVVMGRKTWDSLPEKFSPLPERFNIVMSRDTSWSSDGSETALYIGRAVELAFAEGSEELWVIGGSMIYEMFIDRADEIHSTLVHTRNSGNVSFPVWEKEEWAEEVVEKLDASDVDEYATTYSIWKREK